MQLQGGGAARCYIQLQSDGCTAYAWMWALSQTERGHQAVALPPLADSLQARVGARSGITMSSLLLLLLLPRAGRPRPVLRQEGAAGQASDFYERVGGGSGQAGSVLSGESRQGHGCCVPPLRGLQRASGNEAHPVGPPPPPLLCFIGVLELVGYTFIQWSSALHVWVQPVMAKLPGAFGERTPCILLLACALPPQVPPERVLVVYDDLDLPTAAGVRVHVSSCLWRSSLPSPTADLSSDRKSVV